MLLKIRLLSITITTGGLLILVLCLGSQNLNNRNSVNLGVTSTAPLPIGFLVGLSISLGVLSGGFMQTIIKTTKNDS